MIKIGSSRIKELFPDFSREPKDLDYAVGFDIKSNEKGIEYLYNPIIMNWCGGGGMTDKDALYTLKLSHVVGWRLENRSWDKHVFDIQFLKSKGCEIIWPLFYELYEFWGTIHGPNKRSDLEMSAENFFDNTLDCKYSHDLLHTLINPNPTYISILKDGEEVDVSEEKFNSLSFEEKCNLVYEEVEIMSAERYKGLGYLFRYKRMLDKFIISHAPIWEAIFILENYKFLCKARQNFMIKINSKLKELGYQELV